MEETATVGLLLSFRPQRLAILLTKAPQILSEHGDKSLLQDSTVEAVEAEVEVLAAVQLLQLQRRYVSLSTPQEQLVLLLILMHMQFMVLLPGRAKHVVTILMLVRGEQPMSITISDV